ncbi:MAG: SRPBCC family protein [Acidimicrobiales bacterium]|nr:SRPBCC family protein [Acidimicrobiales bacterium]
MGSYVVDVQKDSTASVEAIWRFLADVTTWTEWSSFDEASYAREGEPPPHGVGAERALRVGPFRSVDTVHSFDPPTRLAYGYSGPIPMKNYRAEVTLTPRGTGTRIRWKAQFSPTIPLTGRLIQALLAKLFRDLSAGLARAAESAVPSGSAGVIDKSAARRSRDQVDVARDRIPATVGRRRRSMRPAS